jgi:hypothetical protein
MYVLQLYYTTVKKQTVFSRSCPILVSTTVMGRLATRLRTLGVGTAVDVPPHGVRL